MKKTIINSVIIQPLFLLLALAFLVISHQYQEHRMIQIHYYILLSSILLVFFTNRSNNKAILLITEVYHLLLFSALSIGYLFLDIEGMPGPQDFFFWMIILVFVVMGLLVTILKLLALLKEHSS